MTNRKILAVWLAVVALNAGLFYGYLRIRDNHARVDAAEAAVENDKAGVDAAWNDVQKSQSVLNRIDKRLTSVRAFLDGREQRYPNGAPPGMVKLYADMAEDRDGILARQAIETKRLNDNIAAHTLAVAAQDRKKQEVEALRRKAWNPFWFP